MIQSDDGRYFEELFKEFIPIIVNEMKRIRITLWDRDDYYQEGRIILAKLLDLELEISLLFSYFKTKYNQHLTDAYRKQEAEKRKFNEQPYLDIHEYGDLVSTSNTMTICDEVAALIDLKAFVKTLTDKEFRIMLMVVKGVKCSPNAKSRLKKKVRDFLNQKD
ncbi:hypothetical protein OZX68_02335 [Streptococcaceae bacterium ESL0729]|nr:hypothetical protein OZX68_02335 [Streptococcaceae bacterium ESL0729]